MCVQVTKTANRFEISSLLEKILFWTSQVVLNFCRTVYKYFRSSTYYAFCSDRKFNIAIKAIHAFWFFF